MKKFSVNRKHVARAEFLGRGGGAAKIRGGKKNFLGRQSNVFRHDMHEILLKMTLN